MAIGSFHMLRKLFNVVFISRDWFTAKISTESTSSAINIVGIY